MVIGPIPDLSHFARSDGNTATADYNSFGQLTSETLFGDTGTTSIDAALSNGLLAPGDSGSLSTDYDVSVTDPDGNTTTVDLNWMSHPTGETEANGGTTSATYNSQGFPVSETNALGVTVLYTYDSAGDVTSITEPSVGGSGSGSGGGSGSGTGDATEYITYDKYGVPTSITDFDGNTTTQQDQDTQLSRRTPRPHPKTKSKTTTPRPRHPSKTKTPSFRAACCRNEDQDTQLSRRVLQEGTA